MARTSRSWVPKLERELFERQQALMRDALGAPSPALGHYEAEYLAATARPFSATTRRAVRARIALSDVVFVGDYHTLGASQVRFTRLVRDAVRTGRRVVVALELFESRHQQALDRFSQGALSTAELLDRCGVDLVDSGGSAAAYATLLQEARDAGVELLGLDLSVHGARRIERRDDHAARLLAARLDRADRPLILALVGQFHVAPPHLPARVAALGDSARRILVVYQNPERAYFRARAQGGLPPEALAFDDGSYALLHTTPAACQQSFLDAVEVPRDDLAGAPRLQVAHCARLIGAAVGVEVSRACRQLSVLDASTLAQAEPLIAAGRLHRAELRVVRAAALARQSCFLPAAQVIYVGRRALSHLAEEAAHLVRHLCVGEAMTRPRPRTEAFHARALEEALGFLGSRWVQPAREVTTLSQWRGLYRTRGADRDLAAYVLAAHRAGVEGTFDADLVPADDETFHAVTHALGYLLGAALDEARLPPAARARLFRDPFEDPRATYAELLRRYGRGASERTISKRAA